MKWFHVFYFFVIVLLAVWGYYRRKLFYTNNDKYKKRYRVLKIILNFIMIICIAIAIYHSCGFSN